MCTSCKRLLPLATTGDGNCLLHAASLGKLRSVDSGWQRPRPALCVVKGQAHAKQSHVHHCLLRQSPTTPGLLVKYLAGLVGTWSTREERPVMIEGGLSGATGMGIKGHNLEQSRGTSWRWWHFTET